MITRIYRVAEWLHAGLWRATLAIFAVYGVVAMPVFHRDVWLRLAMIFIAVALVLTALYMGLIIAQRRAEQRARRTEFRSMRTRTYPWYRRNSWRSHGRKSRATGRIS